MMKLILIFIIIFIKSIKGIQSNINYYNNDSFCKYLADDKALIDKELYYNIKYMNDMNDMNDNEKIRNELYNERKKIDQMIYQLCTTTKKFKF